jgi:prephenate dehydratase
MEGRADFAVMAIENTIAGTLLPNYALLTEFGASIIGEVYHRIEMHLLALEGVRFYDLKYVYSHPIAIEQCRNYLAALPSHISIMEQYDTAASAKYIVEHSRRDVAAIAGESAARLYGLDVLERNIMTHKQNFTRFLILAKEAQQVEGANKASLCFELSHTCGSLARALGVFARCGINLTKIQSVPIIGKPYQYWFYVDIEWQDAAQYGIAMERLRRHVASCRLLGAYQKGMFNVH